MTMGHGSNFNKILEHVGQGWHHFLFIMLNIRDKLLRLQRHVLLMVKDLLKAIWMLGHSSLMICIQLIMFTRKRPWNHMPSKKVEICNQVIKIGKKLNFSLVNVVRMPLWKEIKMWFLYIYGNWCGTTCLSFSRFPSYILIKKRYHILT